MSFAGRELTPEMTEPVQDSFDRVGQDVDLNSRGRSDWQNRTGFKHPIPVTTDSVRFIAHRFPPPARTLPTVGGDWPFRFSRVEFLYMREVFDFAENAVHLRYRTPPFCLPGGEAPSSSCISVFGAQYPACIYPCPTLQVQPHDCPHGSGPGWIATSATPFRKFKLWEQACTPVFLALRSKRFRNPFLHLNGQLLEQGFSFLAVALSKPIAMSGSASC